MISEIEEILYSDLSGYERKLYQKQIKKLNEDTLKWELLETTSSAKKHSWLCLQLYSSLTYQINIFSAKIKNLSQSSERFKDRNRKATSEKERHRHIIEFCRFMGAKGRELMADKKACYQWLDSNALIERYQSKLGRYERDLIFILGRYTQVLKHYLSIETDINEDEQWDKINIEKLLFPWIGYKNNERLQISALNTLKQILMLFNQQSLSTSVDNYVLRCCLDKGLPPWVQIAAVDLMLISQPEKVCEILNVRIIHEKELNCIIRAELVKRWLSTERNQQKIETFVTTSSKIDSPYVQQQILASASRFSEQCKYILFRQFVHLPVENAVLLSLVKAVVKAIKATPMQLRYWALLRQLLKVEVSSIVKRAVLHHIPELLDILYFQKLPLSQQNQLLCLLGNTLENKISSEKSPDAQFWMVQAREIFIAKTTAGDTQGNSLVANNRLPARDSFGIAIDSKSGKISQGWTSHTSIWRLWDQFWNTRTDKRQFHNHTKAKNYHGNIWIPNPTLAELSATEVPGEDVINSETTESNHYLPPIDFLLGLLKRDADYQSGEIITLDGNIRVELPSTTIARFRAYLTINIRVRKFHQLRQGNLKQQTQYIKTLKQLGFNFTISQPDTPFINQISPRNQVKSIYLFNLVPPFILGWWMDFKDYFFSFYQNSIKQLVGFTSLFLVYFIGRHLTINYQIKRLRTHIPLVVGGWGTRGKSGTERLKAALFNGMGFEVFSKTTGCNAMFLHADPNGKLLEYTLYRPFDKATIWEQANALKIAKQRGIDVFLWECMGLNPHYVKILQGWMRDDISTITNCYPDHEDILGPSGWQIAYEMTHFIPPDGYLHTSEEQMLPVLIRGSNQKNTPVNISDWYLRESVTSDVLNSFCYDEHPSNIALVLKVANTIGLSSAQALSYMSERVVADIGVLKSFPKMLFQGSELTFINSMSANERFATLENWRRLGLNDLTRENGDWLTVVINNRADRVARSQVFANLFSKEIRFDHIFLIGTNVDGFMRYFNQSWSQWFLSIQKKATKPDEQHLAIIIDKLKLSDESSWPNELQNIQERLKLEGDINDWKNNSEPSNKILTKVIRHVKQAEKQRIEINQCRSRIGQDDLSWEQLEEQLLSLIKDKVTIVEDKTISGENLAEFIANETPPGLNCRLVGVQNIKGTGYDFMQFWRHWENVHTLIEALSNKNPEQADKAVKTLSQMQKFTFVEVELLERILPEVKASKLAQRQSFQSGIEVIEENLLLNKSVNTSTTQSTYHKLLEQLKNTGATIKRRRAVDKIYYAWSRFRISSSRAIKLLDKLQNSN